MFWIQMNMLHYQHSLSKNLTTGDLQEFQSQNNVPIQLLSWMKTKQKMSISMHQKKLKTILKEVLITFLLPKILTLTILYIKKGKRFSLLQCSIKQLQTILVYGWKCATMTEKLNLKICYYLHSPVVLTPKQKRPNQVSFQACLQC